MQTIQRLTISIPNFYTTPESMALLKGIAEHVDVNTGPRPSPEQLTHYLEETDALIIGIKEYIYPDVFPSKLRTRWLGTLSIGVDHIDLDACEERGLQVINTPAANASSVAEYTIASMLSMVKKMWTCDKAVREGTKRKGVHPFPRDLSAMTVGLLGAGPIAYKVARWLTAMDVTVKAWTYRPDVHQEFDALGVTWVESPEDLCRQVNILSVHLPATPKTKGMIDLPFLNHRAQRPFYLVNTSRADLIAPQTIKQALAQDLLDAVALDVFHDEDRLEDLPVERCLLSPHLAGVTTDSLARMSVALAERLVAQIRQDLQRP